MKLVHGSVEQRQQRWNIGTKVWFHGIVPRPGRTGIVKRVSKPNDLYASVLWEGGTTPEWSMRVHLMAGKCYCNYCASTRTCICRTDNRYVCPVHPREEDRKAPYAAPTYWRDNLAGMKMVDESERLTHL